jgi:hypothetical protein
MEFNRNDQTILRLSFLIVFFLLLSCSDKDKSQGFVLTTNELHEDFEQTVRVIKKNHPAVYDFTPEDRFDSIISEQRKKIAKDITVTEFSKILFPVVNAIGCVHSDLLYPDEILQDSSTKVLPLWVVVIKERCFIINNQGHQKIPIGSEILEINNQTVSLLTKELRQFVARDGSNESTLEAVLDKRFNFLLAIHEDFPDNYTIRYRTGAHVLLDTVMSITRERAEKSVPRKEPLQLEITPAENMAVLTIRSFNFARKRNEFKTFVKRSFDQIQRAHVNNLILDLRDNTGGDPVCASYLLSYLSTRDITYFSRSYPEYDSLSKPISHSTMCFTGNIFTLINGLCLSTTGHISALLKGHRIGTFIGSATGGTYTCNDGSEVYRLRNSGLLLKVANTIYTVDVNNLERFKGIEPDYHVDETLDDVINMRDADKEFAMRLIEESADK